MALHLVTGYAGKTHITAADHGALNAGIFGSKDYVVNIGNTFSAVPITANTIKILDGEVILHGRQIRMEAGDYEEVTVENGTADEKRNDLICIRYMKNSETGIESASCVVVKGTPDKSSPVDPAYNSGSILDGTLTVDFPLYRVPLDGLNVGELIPLFEAKDSLADRMEKVEEQAADKSAIQNIINGTTPAGKAKDSEKLGGKGASEYVTDEEIINIMSISPRISLRGTTVEELDEIYNNYGVAVAGTGNNYHIKVGHTILYPILGGGTFDLIGCAVSEDYEWQMAISYFGMPFFRAKTGGTWGEWLVNATTADLANKLDKTGGTIESGANIPFILKHTGELFCWLGFINKNGANGYLGVNEKHEALFNDTTGSFAILHSGNVGSYALPIGGGTVGNGTDSNPLKIKGNNTDSFIIYKDNNEVTYGLLGFSDVDKPMFINHSISQGYQLHHDGNSAKVAFTTGSTTAPAADALWAHL